MKKTIIKEFNAHLRKKSQKIFFLLVLTAAATFLMLSINIDKVYSPSKKTNSTSTVAVSPTLVYRKEDIAIFLNNSTRNPGWGVYENFTERFVIEFPKDWKIVEHKYSYNNEPLKIGNVSATYVVDGKEYVFSMLGGGSGGPVGELTIQEMQLGTNKYTVKIWHREGQPFFISAIPDDIEVNHLVNHFEIYLPPTGTTQFIDIFYKIVSSFKLNK